MQDLHGQPLLGGPVLLGVPYRVEVALSPSTLDFASFLHDCDLAPLGYSFFHDLHDVFFY